MTIQAYFLYVQDKGQVISEEYICLQKFLEEFCKNHSLQKLNLKDKRPYLHILNAMFLSLIGKAFLK